jgi:hypothetical protein
MNASQLKAMADALATKAGLALTVAGSEAGQWARVVAAAEALSATTSSANPNVAGLMLRTAKALETLSGTTGAEETSTYDGLMKRIVDALEVKASAVTPGSLYGRAVVAAANAVFFSPATLFGAGDQGAWFDASTMSTAVDAGIAQWDDSSGKANHITQATGAIQPLRKSAAEGFFALFDGVNDKLVSTDTDLFITGNLTIVMAVRPIVGQYNLWATAQTAVTTNVPYEFRTNPSGNIEFLMADATVVQQDTSVATVAAGADKVISVRRTSGVGVNLGVDGTEETFVRTLVPTSNGSTVFNMGARNGDTIASANGRIYQALIINRVLTAPELAKVVTYMGAKQGRTI